MFLDSCLVWLLMLVIFHSFSTLSLLIFLPWFFCSECAPCAWLARTKNAGDVRGSEDAHDVSLVRSRALKSHAFYAAGLYFASVLHQVKSSVSKPRATSSPLASEEDDLPSHRTSTTGKLDCYRQLTLNGHWLLFSLVLFVCLRKKFLLCFEWSLKRNGFKQGFRWFLLPNYPYSTLIHIRDLLEPSFLETEGMQGIWEFWKILKKFACLKNDYKPRECK